jgi:carboxypeptidase family protein
VVVFQRAAWALALLLVLSGCSGGAKPQTTPTTSALEPSASAGRGSIAGEVLDEEQRPIEGANVGLLGTPHETQTDAAGKFTFNDLDPGEYDLAIGVLGYESLRRNVTVVPDEVVPFSVKLKAVPLPVESVVRTKTFTGFLQCSYNPYYFVNPCGDAIGKNTDHFRFELEKDLVFKRILLEMTWTPGSAASGQELELDLCVPPDDPSSSATGCFGRDANGEFYAYDSGGAPLVLNLTDAQRGNTPALPWKEFQTYEAWVGNGILSPTPALQQSFTLYLTTCYVADCPKGTTALPPA